MTLRTARRLAVAYLVLMLLSVTWPGMVPFARAEPLVLGLPFSMAWIAAWVAGSAVVMALLDRVEKRARDGAATGGADDPAGRRDGAAS